MCEIGGQAHRSAFPAPVLVERVLAQASSSPLTRSWSRPSGREIVLRAVPSHCASLWASSRHIFGLATCWDAVIWPCAPVYGPSASLSTRARACTRSTRRPCARYACPPRKKPSARVPGREGRRFCRARVSGRGQCLRRIRPATRAPSGSQVSRSAQRCLNYMDGGRCAGRRVTSA